MITLEDMIDLAIEKYYDCKVWDMNTESIIYNGELSNIPYDMLQMNLTTWEMLDEGIIQFNVE